MALAEQLPGFAPLDARTGEPLALALQELVLTGTVLPVGARLFVRHIFTNAEKKPVEVVYAFALPRDGALRQFRIVGEGFSVASELKPTAQAVEAYERGVSRGHLATLARQYQDGVVNLSVGNLRPGETVAVFLEMVAGVDLADTFLRFRFPFTLAPRYHREARAVEVAPGVGEMELPESFGDALLPTWVARGEHLHGVGFHLELALGGWGREVVSPSHPVRVEHGDGGTIQVALGRAEDVPNRDLILEVRDRRELSCLLGGRASDGEGHFALVTPSSFFGSRTEAALRRVVFVLDRSGSMEGRPLTAAKKALARCLGLLRPEDRFSLVAFDSSPEVFSDALLPATSENVERARDFLAGVHAQGGTELVPALEKAAALLAEGGDAVLLTDGQVGSTDWILERARRTGLRIWCLGIGSASEDRFLALLAQETGGGSRFLGPRESVEEAAEAFFKSVGGVVADDLKIAEEGVSVLPKPASTVYAGVPVVLFGDVSSEAAGRVTFRWSRDGAAHVRAVDVALDPDPELASTVALLQGARLLSQLDAQWGKGEGAKGRREQAHLARTMEEVSLRYGLASRVASLVAVVKRAGDRPGEVPEVRVVPVGMPEDTSFEAYFERQGVVAKFGVNLYHEAIEFADAAYESEVEVSRVRPPLPSDARHRLPDKFMETVFLGWLSRVVDDTGVLRTKDPNSRAYAALAALLVIHELLARQLVTPGQVEEHAVRLLELVRNAQFSGVDALLARFLDRFFSRWLADHQAPPATLLEDQELVALVEGLSRDDAEALRQCLSSLDEGQLRALDPSA